MNQKNANFELFFQIEKLPNLYLQQDKSKIDSTYMAKLLTNTCTGWLGYVLCHPGQMHSWIQ